VGFLDGLMRNASTANKEDVAEELSRVVIEGEEVDVAFKLVRDLIVCTDKRLNKVLC